MSQLFLSFYLQLVIVIRRYMHCIDVIIISLSLYSLFISENSGIRSSCVNCVDDNATPAGPWECSVTMSVFLK